MLHLHERDVKTSQSFQSPASIMIVVLTIHFGEERQCDPDLSTVFFGAPLAFLGVAIGLCRRCVIVMSSCRRVFLSSTALHTWAGT